MMTVSELCALTGVTPRTLHHYDAIGLLKPVKVSDARYRYYDESSVSRLHSILLFRELRFSLREIKDILDSPDFDESAAIRQQLELLRLERERLNKLIAYAEELCTKGEKGMDFKAFDSRELEAYKKEVKERWGSTAAYKEFESRGKPDGQSAEMMDIFAEFGKIKSGAADSPEAGVLVGKLKDFISAHYYNCSGEMLSYLGAMYTDDERFRQNIDSAGGDGTAAFTRSAIEAYLAGK